jgi:hypothetical protein
LLLRWAYIASTIIVANELPPPERGGLVARQMRFWNVVFTEISSSTTIIHDLDRPEIIIDLLDYKKAQADRSLTRKKREAMTRLYVKRYEQGLRRFATLKLSARSYGSIEERLYHVYKQSPHGLNALLGGRIKLRTQAGMSDEFKRAADRATVWLPQMEQIFKEEGIPTDITRLAFVESMFNPKALSKVGASGIWQFMPQTARSYMTVNHWRLTNAVRLSKQHELLLDCCGIIIVASRVGLSRSQPTTMVQQACRKRRDNFEQVTLRRFSRTMTNPILDLRARISTPNF